ncbi:MAG: hypothetical protein QOD72_3189, partial [Acidimicrobiaceae bacterium]|nr:hypothetical protein [Acidimicrobiaceae bacterium]
MTDRVARVMPDVRGIDKEFDYSIPDAMDDRVAIGTIVRVALHGRRVRGWVTARPDRAAPGITVRPIAKVSGVGPPEDLIELARWAAWRWATTPSFFMAMASPPLTVGRLPAVRPAPPVPVGIDPLGDAAMAADRAVVRLPPAGDPLGVVLAACRRGNALVIAPAIATARTVAGRLRRAGVNVALHPRDWALGAAGATVVGTRAAAWAPVAELAAVVVLDEHDEALQQEGAPTWHVRHVAIERARRAGVPCVLVSPVPSLDALAWGRLVSLSRVEEREGWPVLEIVDRTRDDPARTSLVTDALMRHLRSASRVVCVLNRPGQARLLACAACGSLARCERCDAAVGEPEPA